MKSIDNCVRSFAVLYILHPASLSSSPLSSSRRRKEKKKRRGLPALYSWRETSGRRFTYLTIHRYHHQPKKVCVFSSSSLLPLLLLFFQNTRAVTPNRCAHTPTTLFFENKRANRRLLLHGGNDCSVAGCSINECNNCFVRLVCRSTGRKVVWLLAFGDLASVGPTSHHTHISSSPSSSPLFFFSSAQGFIISNAYFLAPSPLMHNHVW